MRAYEMAGHREKIAARVSPDTPDRGLGKKWLGVLNREVSLRISECERALEIPRPGPTTELSASLAYWREAASAIDRMVAARRGGAWSPPILDVEVEVDHLVSRSDDWSDEPTEDCGPEVWEIWRRGLPDCVVDRWRTVFVAWYVGFQLPPSLASSVLPAAIHQAMVADMETVVSMARERIAAMNAAARKFTLTTGNTLWNVPAFLCGLGSKEREQVPCPPEWERGDGQVDYRYLLHYVERTEAVPS